MKKFKKQIVGGFLALIILGANVLPAKAVRMEKMEKPPERQNFDVGPTSFPIDADAGGTYTRTIQITNWKRKDVNFKVEVEDFEGSLNPGETVKLQGGEVGRFSARDWVKPELDKFTMQFADRMFMDIVIKVPENADAGDHYASVLISDIPDAPNPEDPEGQKKSNVLISARVGVLFFIKVRGPIKEEGKLDSFTSVKKWYENTHDEKKPVEFRSVFSNPGSVRLQPSGKIEIRNMLGQTVDNIIVDPYNVLRDSARGMSFVWKNNGFFLGRYTAKITLDRGYQNLQDVKTVSFYMFPWKVLLLGLVIFIIFLIVMRFLVKNMDIKIGFKKKK